MGVSQQIYGFLSIHPEYRANLGLYKSDKNTLDTIKANIKGIDIKVFCGDWCPDCRMQLPRFFNILLALEREDIGLEIIEVDRSKIDGESRVKEMDVLA